MSLPARGRTFAYFRAGFRHPSRLPPKIMGGEKLIEKKTKAEAISLSRELRKVQDIPLDRLSIQLGVEPEAARMIQNLIRDFLSEHEEENGNPYRPIFFHKSGCQCEWCKLR